MRLANDYLEQARHLARRERTRPKQASLRRAISAAYYALFHLLCDEASSLLVRGIRDSDELQARTARTLEHGTMARACRAFESGALPPGLRFLGPLNADYALSLKFSDECRNNDTPPITTRKPNFRAPTRWHSLMKSKPPSTPTTAFAPPTPRPSVLTV